MSKQQLFSLAILFSVMFGILGIWTEQDNFLFVAVILGGLGVFGPKIYKDK
ncbi:hypothetical protein M1N17_00780 [Dehalococcoidia bacterium]|nr:hypothetical protein [Dehalococcoidia bacterium]